MASQLGKFAVGGLTTTVGAGLAAYLFLDDEKDRRVSLHILIITVLFNCLSGEQYTHCKTLQELKDRYLPEMLK